MQRDRHQHALAEIADGRHEDRSPRELGIALKLGDVLVLERQPIELE